VFYRAGPRIHCLKVILKPLLVFGLQTDELDSHANSGVAGANENTRRDILPPNPQVSVKTRSNRPGQDGLHVADTFGGRLARHNMSVIAARNTCQGPSNGMT
jgi:hypothetical protein